MKKIFTLFVAALMSAGMFADRSYLPSDALINSLTDATCKVCIYVEDDCNDIYFVGSYNGWNYNPNSSVQFDPVPGENYDGWYVASFDDFDSSPIEGVPVIDRGDGVIEAAYMIGAFEGVRGGTEAVKDGDVITKLTNFDANVPNVFFVNAWKTNPCTSAPVEPATPVISGDEQFEESTTITITCETEGVEIYYTLDGSDPASLEADEYIAPFEITETTTVKAVAYNPLNDFYSEVAEMTFTKAESQSSETVVVLTEADYQGNNIFEKDGVTLTVARVDADSWYITGPGTFTNSLGKNFIKIEVTPVGGNAFIYGDGWEGDYQNKTWTGNAPTVSFNEDIQGQMEGFTATCTLEEPTAVENVQGNQVQGAKFFRDGQLFIEHDGKIYNILGATVK